MYTISKMKRLNWLEDSLYHECAINTCYKNKCRNSVIDPSKFISEHVKFVFCTKTNCNKVVCVACWSKNYAKEIKAKDLPKFPSKHELEHKEDIEDRQHIDQESQESVLTTIIPDESDIDIINETSKCDDEEANEGKKVNEDDDDELDKSDDELTQSENESVEY